MAWVNMQIRSAARAFWGTRLARADLRQSKAQLENPVLGIKRLFAAHSPHNDDEKPIFILSAGWRSGSTLLQRLISSGQNVLIWGEPYDRANIVQSLMRTAAPFSRTWPPDGLIEATENLEALTSSWTANLYPSEAEIFAAHREFFMRLFAVPARELGAQHWGLKEVRFGYAEAIYLHALFPEARFLFIRRPLEDAYRSYRDFSGSMAWYAHWPDVPAFTPYGFAKHWGRMTQEIADAAQETGGFLIEYEDLARGEINWRALSDYCGFAIDSRVLQRRIGGRNNAAKKTISGFERLGLNLGRRAAAGKT